IVTLFAPEPRGAAPPRTLAQAVIQPFAEFMKRRGWLLVLVFIVVFRLPDVMAGAMRMPFLQRGVGFTKEQIGTIANSYGMFMTIVGALFGGGVVARLGLWRSLWVFAALQALSNFGFYMLTLSGPDRAALTVVISVENFCGGLVTAGFVAFLMSQCDRRFSATQYALLSSLMAVTGVIAGTPTGALVERAGWQTFFLVSIVMAIPGLALLPFVKPSTIDAPGTAPASRERDGFEVVASK
ncbi:MAG: MFS transporter, partial [Tepidisphaeraceae bacterium]